MPTSRLYRTGTCTVVTMTQTTSTLTSHHQTTVSEHHATMYVMCVDSFISCYRHVCQYNTCSLHAYIIRCSRHDLARAYKVINITTNTTIVQYYTYNITNNITSRVYPRTLMPNLNNIIIYIYIYIFTLYDTIYIRVNLFLS